MMEISSTNYKDMFLINSGITFLMKLPIVL